jgi:putative SOS response-associated peptidase YedK
MKRADDFSQRANLALAVERFGVEASELVQLPIRYNISPDQNRANVAVVRMMDGKRQLSLLRWGLIPSWSPEPRTKYNTSNARADTVATKPAFRAAYKSRRCLVLADGYYEWLRVGKSKRPYLYEVDGGKPFALAGLWESWRGTEGAPLESFAIIVTEANELAGKIHDRMPVILEDCDYEAWLDPDNCEVGHLLAQFPAERMTARLVSSYVNDARHEGPQCIAPPDE